RRNNRRSNGTPTSRVSPFRISRFGLLSSFVIRHSDLQSAGSRDAGESIALNPANRSGDQLVQLGISRAAVDQLARQVPASRERFAFSSDEQRRRRIEQHGVALRTALLIQ